MTYNWNWKINCIISSNLKLIFLILHHETWSIVKTPDKRTKEKSKCSIIIWFHLAKFSCLTLNMGPFTTSGFSQNQCTPWISNHENQHCTMWTYLLYKESSLKQADPKTDEPYHFKANQVYWFLSTHTGVQLFPMLWRIRSFCIFLPSVQQAVWSGSHCISEGLLQSQHGSQMVGRHWS